MSLGGLWREFKAEVKDDWESFDDKIEDKLSACLSARDWETFFRGQFGRQRSSNSDNMLYDPQNEGAGKDSAGEGAEKGDKTATTDAPPVAESKIEWEKDVSTCYDKAKASGKPMIVLFATDWCGYCYKLENEVLRRDEMQQYLDKGVFVIANPEKDGDAKELAAGLKVDGYPAMSIIDVKDDGLFERGRIIGLLTPDKFFAQMAQHLPAIDGPTSLRPGPGRSATAVV